MKAPDVQLEKQNPTVQPSGFDPLPMYVDRFVSFDASNGKHFEGEGELHIHRVMDENGARGRVEIFLSGNAADGSAISIQLRRFVNATGPWTWDREPLMGPLDLVEEETYAAYWAYNSPDETSDPVPLNGTLSLEVWDGFVSGEVALDHELGTVRFRGWPWSSCATGDNQSGTLEFKEEWCHAYAPIGLPEPKRKQYGLE